MASQQVIPWAKPEFWGDEQRFVIEALRSQWISGGPFVNRLEEEFATFNGTAHAVATSNGTTALHLAYLAIGIQPGDEIIVPGFAFMAAANVALHMHAVPVFADVDPKTWLITAAEVERRWTVKTRAIVPVHTYGNVCAMDDIMTLANNRSIPVIEDAAEAFASSYRGHPAGTLGALGTYSFHATKTITTGEGGMVVTGRDALKEQMHLYRSHGMSSVRYWHDVAGHNFRLTNMQAALGCAQLANVDKIIASRKRMFANYQKHLDGVDGLSMQYFAPEVEPVPWVVGVKLDARAFPQGRDQVMRDMQSVGIETRPGFYTPTSMEHLYRSTFLPVSDDVSGWVVVLPAFCSLNEQEIETVCVKLKRMRR